MSYDTFWWGPKPLCFGAKTLYFWSCCIYRPPYSAIRHFSGRANTSMLRCKIAVFLESSYLATSKQCHMALFGVGQNLNFIMLQLCFCRAVVFRDHQTVSNDILSWMRKPYRFTAKTLHFWSRYIYGHPTVSYNTFSGSLKFNSSIQKRCIFGFAVISNHQTVSQTSFSGKPNLNSSMRKHCVFAIDVFSDNKKGSHYSFLGWLSLKSF